MIFSLKIVDDASEQCLGCTLKLSENFHFTLCGSRENILLREVFSYPSKFSHSTHLLIQCTLPNFICIVDSLSNRTVYFAIAGSNVDWQLNLPSPPRPANFRNSASSAHEQLIMENLMQQWSSAERKLLTLIHTGYVPASNMAAAGWNRVYVVLWFSKFSVWNAGSIGALWQYLILWLCVILKMVEPVIPASEMLLSIQAS